MEFDETLFNATMDAAITETQRNNAMMDTGVSRSDANVDALPSKTNGQKVHKQTFYPTPNSSSMLPNGTDKQFMSPFPTNYQNYPNVGAETNFAELDEVRREPADTCAPTLIC